MDKLVNNSAEALRSRLMEWMKTHGQFTTIDSRKLLDVLAPAPRIFELRHKFGINITTVRVDQQTDCGKFHRLAKYVLASRNVA